VWRSSRREERKEDKAATQHFWFTTDTWIGIVESSVNCQFELDAARRIFLPTRGANPVPRGVFAELLVVGSVVFPACPSSGATSWLSSTSRTSPQLSSGSSGTQFSSHGTSQVCWVWATRTGEVRPEGERSASESGSQQSGQTQCRFSPHVVGGRQASRHSQSEASQRSGTLLEDVVAALSPASIAGEELETRPSTGNLDYPRRNEKFQAHGD